MNKNYYILKSDTESTIEYVGLWSILDELIKKVKETEDPEKIKLYCEMFGKLYKLLESKGE